MKGLFVILLIFVIASPSLCGKVRLEEASSSFNVVSYGAKGDGQTDDSKAFLKAWEDVCNATQDNPRLVIPDSKTFMLQPVLFQGPCKPTTVNVKLQGNITAPKIAKDWQWPKGMDNRAWVEFSKIYHLVVDGGGQVDGQGASWWQLEFNSRPTALKFHKCENLSLSTLTHINSPRNHISLNMCKSSKIFNVSIMAPEKSPNTDGIDISASSHLLIRDSTIKTGDDCIAINSGSFFIKITGIFCGPGHGISVGSLGRNGEYATVEHIRVLNCTFTNTTNGARIKTWQGGDGYARNITFEDIILAGAKNPLIINQQYSYLNGGKAVQISGVTFRNFKGTSSDEDAITLNCDNSIGCFKILLDDISITTKDGNKTQAICKNVKGTCHSCDPIVPCLSKQ